MSQGIRYYVLGRSDFNISDPLFSQQRYLAADYPPVVTEINMHALLHSACMFMGEIWERSLSDDSYLMLYLIVNDQFKVFLYRFY